MTASGGGLPAARPARGHDERVHLAAEGRTEPVGRPARSAYSRQRAARLPQHARDLAAVAGLRLLPGLRGQVETGRDGPLDRRGEVGADPQPERGAGLLEQDHPVRVDVPGGPPGLGAGQQREARLQAGQQRLPAGEVSGGERHYASGSPMRFASGALLLTVCSH